MKIIKNLSSVVIVLVTTIVITSCSTKTAIDTTTEVSTTTQIEQEESINEPIQSISELSNFLSLGCQAGTTGETWLLNNTSNSTVSKYKSNHDLVNGLLKGVVDAIIIDQLPAEYFLENNPQLQKSDLKFTTQEYAFAFKKGNMELRQAVNSTINTFKKEGVFDQLSSIYMPTQGEVTLPEKISFNGADTTIKVGTCADFYPFEYYVDNVLYGYDITLIEKIADYNSWNIEFIEMDFNQLITALENEEIDIIAAAMSVTDERYDIIDFSTSYFETEQVILTKK